jgi:hypothetical protein
MGIVSGEVLNQHREKPRRIWLRSLYGFNPEDAGYIGWTEEGPRDRMLGLIEDGDLFMIYGASTAETARHHRNRVLGFLQVRVGSIRDKDKSSPSAILEKKARGWQDKWTYAIPVVRAWRVDEPVLLETIAPKTYRPEAGQAIAVWNPPLLPEEIDLALKINVTEVRVHSEPELPERTLKNVRFAQAFRPSRAFPGSFGERTALYEDGPTYLYLARFEGDGLALMGLPKSPFDKTSLLKIGISNDKSRRLSELNAGFPPASLGKWTMAMVSEVFEGRQAAESAEQAFKDRAEEQLQSLGGEFFRGDWTAAQLIFAAVPGVARFGKR